MRQIKDKRKAPDLSEQDWEKIKKEYITSDMGYRDIANKYGISYVRVQARGRLDGYVEGRKQWKSDVMSKSLDKLSDLASDRVVKAMAVADKALDKIEQALDEVDIVLCKTSDTSRWQEQTDDTIVDRSHTDEDIRAKKVAIDKYGLKQITAALRDLKEIGLFRAGLDEQEQRARIAKLRHDVESETEQDKTIIVRFEDEELSEYAD